MRVLIDERDTVTQKMALLEDSERLVTTRIDLIREGLSATAETVELRDMPDLHIILGQRNHFASDGEFHGPFTDFCMRYQNESSLLSYPVGGYFDDMETFVSAPASPSHFFFVHPQGASVRPAGRYIVGHVRAYYGETNGIEKKMLAFAKKNKLTPTGPVYNIFLLDEITNIDHDSYLLQASVAVE
jgi:hypothetical protein